MAEHVEQRIEKLKGAESYPIWKFQVYTHLEAENILEIANGDLKYEDTEEKNQLMWKLMDAKARRLITFSVDKSLLVHIMSFKTSYEMLQSLNNIFERDTEHQRCKLLSNFYNFKFDTNVDVLSNVGKLQNIVFQLNQLKDKIDDTMIITKILTILPEKYKTLVTAWDSTEQEKRTISNLISRLQLEESTYLDEKEVTTAFMSKSKNCFNCGKYGHFKKDCKQNKIKCKICNKSNHKTENCFYKNKDKFETKKCTVCNKNNHKTEDCYFKNKNRNSNSNAAVFMNYEKNKNNSNKIKNENVNFIQNKQDSVQFIVDSGATTHIVNCVDMLSDITKCETKIMTAKKNNEINSDYIGKFNGTECILKKVLHAQDLSKNLISVQSITNNNGIVTFTKDKVFIKQNGKVVVDGKKQDNGLYTVEIHKKKSENCLLTENENWHRRMGHLSENNLKILSKLVNGMNLIPKITGLCKICLESRQPRLPFNNIRTRAERPLQLIHTDIVGPIEETTWDNKKYILTILDDYTHFCQIYLLQHKSEAKEYIKTFIHQSENQMNLKVAKIRCDNGGEFINNVLKEWCKNEGKELDVTIPYTSQLNGKAERLNRTIMEKTRALLYDSNLSNKFWGEAAKAATYLLNRSPSRTVSVTPAELWLNKKPDLSNIKIFGCKAYAKNLGHLRKLEKRSKEYKMIGYAQNGYRLWDEEGEKIIIARDIRFDENFRDENLENNNQKKNELIFKNYINENNEEIVNENEEENIPEIVNENEEENIQEIVNENEDENIDEITEIDTEINDHTKNQTKDKPKRNIQMPKKFNDYEMFNVIHACNYVAEVEIPDSYIDIDKYNESAYWKNAVKNELKAIKNNETWIKVKKPENEKILDTKWVFTYKEKEEKNMKFKARLVVRGFAQIDNFEKIDIYSPVAKLTTIRTLLEIGNQNNHHFIQLDISNAFLNGTLNEDVYIYPPDGDKVENDYVYKLKKSLYGLKQSANCWNKDFKKFMEDIGFENTQSDQCLFKMKQNKEIIFLLLYVDDIILSSRDLSLINKIVKLLKKRFKLKEKGKLKYFLGLEIDYNQQDGILKITQENYINKLLKKFGFSDCKTSDTPIEEKLYNIENSEQLKICNKPYRELIGCLMYLMLCSRPDISFALNYYSRFQEKPTDQLYNHLTRILRYLKKTPNIGLVYKRTENCYKIEAYVDADWGQDKIDRKSVSGYCFMLDGNVIGWSSRKQKCIALSSTEAEVVSLCECLTDGIWIKKLLNEMEINISQPMIFYEDNQACISILNDPGKLKRIKHIDIKLKFVQEKIQNNEIKIEYISTNDQIADVFTKGLAKIKFNYHKKKLLNEY